MSCFDLKKFLILHSSFLILLTSCSVSKQITTQANTILLKDSSISRGHIGVSIYEPATGKYWYEHDATKYFVPASNTKLFTLYAGMKYLGDSLVGIYYQNINDSVINISGNGDPTFLHPDYTYQPVWDFLKQQHKTIYVAGTFTDNPLGYGWAWDDYNDDYMVERSAFPVFGNTVKISWDANRHLQTDPAYFKQFLPVGLTADLKNTPTGFSIKRERASNKFNLVRSSASFTKAEIPFATNNLQTTTAILRQLLNVQVIDTLVNVYPSANTNPANAKVHEIRTQPTDSLFKPMMHRSDNFFAEQTLLMASDQHLGVMNDAAIIDTILNKDLSDIPQRPKWVDGSGLSRYNLFTPQDFVYILNKIKNEFGLERIKNILPTGGTGTIAAYYKKEKGYIFVKTGTLSNNCALSGYLYTKKGKLLIFSVLTNNYIGSATPIRRATEKFLEGIREKY